MKSVLRMVLALLCVFLVGGALGAEVDPQDAARDERFEALAKRVTHVEALIGPGERAVPGKPTIALRLDRLEDKAGESRTEARATEKATAADFRELQQAVKDLAAGLRAVTDRLAKLERTVEASAESDTVRDLKRDLEGLRRGLEAMQAKVR